MKKTIVLFRAINVGGKNLLPMKELVPLLEQANFEEVAYYIQSGNVVLKAPEHNGENENDKEKLSNAIKEIVLNNFGFTPEVLLFSESDFEEIVANNPYQAFEGKFVHFYLCLNSVELNQEKLTKYLAESESYSVVENVFYLHAPGGIGRSKLVANIEACLGQVSTGRNLNTVNKIRAMLAK